MVEEAVNLKRRPEDAVQQDGPQQPPNVKAKDTENAEDVVKKTPKQLEKEKRKLELKERRQKKNQQEKDAVSKIPSVQIREQEKRSYEEEKKFITRISANCKWTFIFQSSTYNVDHISHHLYSRDQSSVHLFNSNTS